jgi:hypothetical protein
MKRHAPGLYTEGNYAISRECECTGYCGGKWVQRTVLSWYEDGYPDELGYLGLMASTKAELLRLIAQEVRA